MKELLKTLCCLDGTSGREDAVRDYIISQLNGAPYTVDPLGNLIVRVKGAKPAKNTVMLCAHMDEVGVMATCILQNGLVRFTNVGGIQPTALAGKSVRFENGVYGVIGLKPMHLCEGDERLTLPEVRELTIDIGAADREAAAARVRPGDAAVFTNEFVALGGGKVLSKAIDDRAGCAVMLDMIRTGMEYDTVFCFNVQEEVGLRGAKTSTFAVRPDYAIVLEATTAADLPGAAEDARVCVLGEGAAISFMDKATVYDPKLYNRVLSLAAEAGIKAQPKTAVAGGNDAGSVHLTAEGVRTVAISVPCRYIHAGSSVCDMEDVLAVRALAERTAAYFANADGTAV